MKHPVQIIYIAKN